MDSLVPIGAIAWAVIALVAVAIRCSGDRG